MCLAARMKVIEFRGNLPGGFRTRQVTVVETDGL